MRVEVFQACYVTRSGNEWFILPILSTLIISGCGNDREVLLFSPDIEKSEAELNDDAKEYLTYIKSVKDQGFDLTAEEVKSKNKAKKIMRDYFLDEMRFNRNGNNSNYIC